MQMLLVGRRKIEAKEKARKTEEERRKRKERYDRPGRGAAA